MHGPVPTRVKAGRRDENKARKRADLLRTALDLFLTQGYADTSIEQITAAAGVARGTFYLYFDHKEAIFRELVGAFLNPAVDALVEARRDLEAARTVQATRAAYDALQQALISAVLAHKRAALLYYREQRNPGRVGRWIRTRSAQVDAFVADLVGSLMARGLLRRRDQRVVALAIAGAIDRLVFTYLSGESIGDPVAVGEEIIRLFGEGLV
jgi:AcrR family transcriptional regulator